MGRPKKEQSEAETVTKARKHTEDEKRNRAERKRLLNNLRAVSNTPEKYKMDEALLHAAETCRRLQREELRLLRTKLELTKDRLQLDVTADRLRLEMVMRELQDEGRRFPPSQPEQLTPPREESTPIGRIEDTPPTFDVDSFLQNGEDEELPTPKENEDLSKILLDFVMSAKLPS